MLRRGASVLEVLLAASILSVAIIPLFYIFQITKKTHHESVMEFQATLLAQHVIEEIIAYCKANPSSLPPMSSEAPVVVIPGHPQNVSDYFRELLGVSDGLDEKNAPDLYWALKPFTCRVDTYFLENNLYKVIVYIFYEEFGKKKRVFLERLISRIPEKKDSHVQGEP